MGRLSENEKKFILNLMKDGKSLNYISKLTKLGKSTLYYYYKREFGKKYKDLEIGCEESFIGELMGLFVGDGYTFLDAKTYSYTTRFYFNYSEKRFVDEIVKLFAKKFNKKPMLYRTKNVLIVRYTSKQLFEFILRYVGWGISRNSIGINKKSRTVFLRKNKYPRNFKIGFLRGFIDSDGHISNKKMVLSSASKKIMEQTREFLEDLCFKEFRFSFYDDKRGNRVGMYHISLRKAERDNFFKIIKPRNLVKLNAPAGI